MGSRRRRLLLDLEELCTIDALNPSFNSFLNDFASSTLKSAFGIK